MKYFIAFLLFLFAGICQAVPPDTCIYMKFNASGRNLVPAPTTNPDVYANPGRTKIGTLDVGAYVVLETKIEKGIKYYLIGTAPGEKDDPIKTLGWVKAVDYLIVPWRNCEF